MKASFIALLLSALASPCILLAGATAILETGLEVRVAKEAIYQSLDANQSAFLSSFQDFVASSKALDKTMNLVNPPDWGKTLSEKTHGSIEFKKSFPGGFVGMLTLTDLEPNKNYRLTLNGKPGLKGNELLPTPVPGLPDEFFYDFLDIVSDENGNYQHLLGIMLKPGDYDVRIYVKDTNDWKIVLYRDYFEFTVE